MYLIRCAAFCLLFLSHAAFSQHADTLVFSQSFSYTPYHDPRADIVNHFLQKIAEGNGRLRAYTAYTLTGVMFANYRPMPDRQCELTLKITDYSFSGDIHYKDFSLEKMLMPDRITFRVEAAMPGGSRGVNKIFDVALMPGNITEPVFLPAGGICTPEAGNLRITNISLYYSEHIYARFDSWLAALESYYRSKVLLSELAEELPLIRFDDPETLLLEEFRLCEAEQKLAYVQYADFHAWVDLTRGDPEDVLPRYLSASMQMRDIRSSFNRAISRIDTLYYEKALSTGGDAHESQRLFRLALTYNPYHIPSNLAVASYDHTRRNFREALSRLSQVHAVMLPTGIWKSHADTLTQAVLDTCFAEVRELIADGSFLDGLAVLDDVEAFCNATFGRYACPRELFLLQSESHKGMFRSFLRVSGRALAGGNLTLCFTYLESAIEYHRNYASYIFDRREAVDLLQRLVDRYWELGDEQYTEGNIIDAAAFFLRAKEICEKYPFVTCK